jgi:hypothetical protein
MQPIKSFNGLNNVSDPLRLGLGWLTTADNVDVSDAGALSKRHGYMLAQAGSFTSAFSTFDSQRCYLIKNGTLIDFNGVVLKSGINTAPMYWAEINNQVFFNNGVDSGIILQDNTVIDWEWIAPASPNVAAVTGNLPAGVYQVRCTFTLFDGRETGASEVAEISLADGQALQISGIELKPSHVTHVYVAPADSTVFQKAFSTTSQTAFVWNSPVETLGTDLLNVFLDPLPSTDVIQAWKGRMYASKYIESENQSVIWFSEPLGFHLFKLNQNFIMVSGRVTMLAPHDEALIVGTTQKIHAYDGLNLIRLADYGVVAGQHWAKDDSRILFWSDRGLCAALPFSNLTEQQVSVAPGVSAGGTIVRHHGQKRYVVALQQGGSAFNSYS